MTLTLSSPDFSEGGMIPRRFTCDGADVSPALSWEGAPDDTLSLTLIVDDPDARGFAHWVLFDLAPAASSAVPAGVSASPDAPPQGMNDFGRIGYAGPCPPSGSHRYVFTLYALDGLLGLPGSPRPEEVRQALRGPRPRRGAADGIVSAQLGEPDRTIARSWLAEALRSERAGRSVLQPLLGPFVCSALPSRRCVVSSALPSPSRAGCSTRATTRLAMKRPLRTGRPVRVTSATSTTPRLVVISMRRPARVALDLEALHASGTGIDQDLHSVALHDIPDAMAQAITCPPRASHRAPIVAHPDAVARHRPR